MKIVIGDQTIKASEEQKIPQWVCFVVSLRTESEAYGAPLVYFQFRLWLFPRPGCHLSFCCRSSPAVLSTITILWLSVSTPFARHAALNSANDKKISHVPRPPPPHSLYTHFMVDANRTSFLYFCQLFFWIIHNTHVSAATLQILPFKIFPVSALLFTYLPFWQITWQQSSWVRTCD